MIKQIFEMAIEKAGSQEKLAQRLGITQQKVSTFKNYKGKGIKPSDTLIAELAIYIGINPLEAILLCKAETEGKEKSTLWETWISEYWHSIGDSNPCYRRERAMS